MSDVSSSNWNKQIEAVLNDIRLNCNELEEFHKKKYFSVKSVVVWFKLPIIILSSLNAIVAVSLTIYKCIQLWIIIHYRYSHIYIIVSKNRRQVRDRVVS